MNWIKGLFGGVKRGVKVTKRSEYESRLTGMGNGIDFGVNVTNDAAQRITAVFAAIRIRSENLASLPKAVSKRTANGWEVAATHPVHRLMRQRPNGYMNIFDFWFCVNANMDGWGNSYALIERDKHGDPVALHPIRAKQVMVGFDKTRHTKNYRVYGSDGFDGVYLDYEVCHFKLYSLDGIRGVDPIEYNAIALGKGIAATKFGAEFYKKGGNIKGVLEADGSMDDAAFKAFMDHYKKSSQNYDTPLLEYGIKYKQVGISPVAAQLLQTEIFAIQDVARIFNIPPHMLSELSKATFSNIEHQTLQFLQYSLRPSVKRFESELENKLFFPDELDNYQVKFNLNGMMRGDMQARADHYAKGILNGWYTRNEVRELEGLPRLEHLDKALYPMNTQIAGEEIKQDNKSKE